jgi:hypothetical protein
MWHLRNSRTRFNWQARTEALSEQHGPERAPEDVKTTWHATLRQAEIPYFRIYDLTFATRLSAGNVADEWITQLPRQGDAQVF